MAKRDGWDIGRWLSTGIGVAALIVSKVADDEGHKDAANWVTGIATAARMGLEVVTPPRCPTCGARSVSTSAAQGQFCPNGHGAVDWQA